ncbi:MAG: LruC domain-containing protein [Bacteroidota bacterium]
MFTNCEHVIGDLDVEEPPTFQEIQVPYSFNFLTSEPVDLMFPSTRTNHLAKVYQTHGDQTSFLGTYLLESDLLTLDIERSSSTVYTVPTGISGNGDYMFEMGGASGESGAKSKNIPLDNLHPMGSWNRSGVPDYLMDERDELDQSLINDIAVSLPEGRPVPTYSSEYLNGLDMNTIINDSAEVWVTFVHEGAGYRNVLGYFSFDTDNPPASLDDIDSLHVVFPNVSFAGSGGGLYMGDKVYLGSFSAGTSIAWFLMPNAWNWRSRSINDVDDVKFSINDFNDFTEEVYNQHVILLEDEERELLLLSFEDISRPGGDNDFNDAIFYVTASPYDAIETGNVVPTKKANDVDGDGLSGYEDEFPTDPERAFSSYWPAYNTYATILFEDQWPSVGDYDFNDLVADYKFTYIKSADGNVKELNIETILKAVGGLKKGSLLFNLGLDETLVESVSGNILEYDFIKLNANGTEAGLSEAVIPIFDNSRTVLAPPSGFSVTNVFNDQPHVDEVKIITKVVFKDPISESLINKYDPFMVTEFNRGLEIHLPGQQPTAKANLELFGTQDDASNFDQGFTYKNVDGLPWALHVMESIKYPKENSDFANAYVNFRNWAESGGVTHTDWFYQSQSNMNSVMFYNNN